jgi:Zn ribbon nucleic-acid-binding protein/uncharacterized protein YbaR (Trm112 family)
MQSETKICQNCKKQFAIEPEDSQFYEKISVPAPTFCPECRMQRRLAWFNLINLYKRKCDLCGKDSISMYAPEAPYKVYCPRCWWSDNWDSFAYGRDYDFSRPFFEQFNELLHEVPLQGLSVDFIGAESSPYTNYTGHLKNCYLLFWADYNEDCAYGFHVAKDKTVFDCSLLMLCEFCYELTHGYKAAHSVASYELRESIDCAFLRDCENCQNCFASANLRNKKYYIFNEPKTKEQYFKETKQWDFGSYTAYEKARTIAEEHWRKFPPMSRYEKFTVNSTGNRIYQSKNCKECFEVVGAENCRYVSMLLDSPTKDCYDISGWGNNLSNSYDCGIVGENSSNLKFCHDSGINLYNVEYCKQTFGGSYQFGCVSVKKGNYCILNKRYSEEKFWKLREKIIAHMNEVLYTDKRGRVYRYGEFFPIELSPSAYNETIAAKFFPLSKKEIQAQGYRYREPDIREYTITKPAAELPDHIKDTPDFLLDEVIGCNACPRGFRIIPQEIAFLRRMNLPLPRRCPFCRIEEKLDQWVKEFRLTTRTCDQCGTTFKTPHHKEDAPRILCKQCWLKEVI